MQRLTGADDIRFGSVLRPFRSSDVEVLDILRSDVDTQHLLLAHPDAAPTDVLAWIERRRHEAGSFFAVVTVPPSNDAVGFVQMTALHRIDRHALGGIAILPSKRRMGVGRRAMGALIDTARSDHRLRKLMLQVRSDNHPALSLYESLNFTSVGVMRAHYDDGCHYHDVVLLELPLNGE